MIAKPASIPLIEGKETLLEFEGDDTCGDCLVTMGEPGGDHAPVALIDGVAASAYPMDGGGDPRAAGVEPLVIVTGDLEGSTGQVKILQPDGVYRRYSRWDKVDPSDYPDTPDAYVRSLPQCGCGGYLGAPTVFDSFAEMVAYFYVVFVFAR